MREAEVVDQRSGRADCRCGIIAIFDKKVVYISIALHIDGMKSAIVYAVTGPLVPLT